MAKKRAKTVNKKNTEKVSEKFETKAEILKHIVVADAFQNQMARLGFEQPNVAEGAQYPNTRMTNNYNLFNSLYRSSWIIRKIIDVVPADMLKNWIKITSEIEPEEINKINRCVYKTNTKSKLREGLKWARLYGGAVGLILVDGDENLEESLNLDAMMPDSYKGLLIFDRWSGVQPSIELVSDITNSEFGKPEYYLIDLNAANTTAGVLNAFESENILKVHHSRIIRFEGRELPFFERMYEYGWGESEVEIVFEELKKRDNTSYNIASLVFLANIKVMKTANMNELLGSGSQRAQERLYQTMSAQNYILNNMGMMLLDKEDDFGTHQYSFSGLSDIYESFMLDVAGAAEMPVTKLFGRNPAGFNATGESDLTQYYETIEEKQETYLLPIIEKLLPIVCMSALGELPNDLEWEFNPCMTSTNKDLADLAQNMSSPVFDAYSDGLIDRETALKELRQQMDITGMWSNITEEVIEKSSESNSIFEESENNELINEIYNTENNEEIKPEQNTSNDEENKEISWKEKISSILRG